MEEEAEEEIKEEEDLKEDEPVDVDIPEGILRTIYVYQEDYIPT